jgi:hypothetical protein
MRDVELVGEADFEFALLVHSRYDFPVRPYGENEQASTLHKGVSGVPQLNDRLVVLREILLRAASCQQGGQEDSDYSLHVHAVRRLSLGPTGSTGFWRGFIDLDGILSSRYA